MTSDPSNFPKPQTEETYISEAIARAKKLRKSGRLSEAIAEFEQILSAHPHDPIVHFEMGMTYHNENRFDAAESSWRKAVELCPTLQSAWLGLGMLYSRLGRLDLAVESCSRAVKLKPDEIPARLALARAFHLSHKYKEAIEEYECVIQLDPWNAAAMNNYGNLLVDARLPAKAVHFFRSALAMNPNDLEIHSNLGNVLKKQGRLDEAVACYKRTLRLRPDAWKTHSNLLLLRNSQPGAEKGLLSDHVAWANQHASRFYPGRVSFPNNRSPGRRLRIGYISPDFRRHSVAYFIQPILRNHDRANFEVFCYSDVSRSDDMTQSLRQAVEHWEQITGLNDDQTAGKIREDQIDILVDLAGHTGSNRLLVFARRAAPVQVSYLGYPNTTGLATMDYRLTDVQADPVGMTEGHYAEKLIRLPHGFLCYGPTPEILPVRKTATIGRLPVTFGCFNNLAKVNKTIIAAWAELLRRVPESTLLMKADGFADEQTRFDLCSVLSENGIAESRVRLLPRAPAFAKHMSMYHEMDIALDTFPYHGTTTTCEALYMGVPVVALAGKAHLCRVGVSLLSGLELQELIADTLDRYVAIAVELARDPMRRSKLLDELRPRMLRSFLTNGRSFTQDLEQAYRQMWDSWLKQSASAINLCE